MENGSARRFEVELPVGYVDEDGRLHKLVSLRKMTGHEEALLGDRKLRQNGGRLVTEVLSSCVKRIGDLEPVTAPIIAALTSADRNYLLLELRKITFGEQIEDFRFALGKMHCFIGFGHWSVKCLDHAPRDFRAHRCAALSHVEDGLAHFRR